MAIERDDEDIVQLTGLGGPARWAQADQLLQAKARVVVADKHPKSAAALTLLDQALSDIYQSYLGKARNERQQALAVIENYTNGLISITQCWEDLRIIVEPDAREWR